MKCNIVAAGRLTGIDPAILAAIASRESGAGLRLNSRGYGNSFSTKYGYMQLDTRRYYVDTSEGPNGLAYFDQAAEELRSAIIYVETKRPYWEKPMQIKGGIAAYDVGINNYSVSAASTIDIGTTNHDYSNDVLARAKYLRSKGIF